MNLTVIKGFPVSRLFTVLNWLRSGTNSGIRTSIQKWKREERERSDTSWYVIQLVKSYNRRGFDFSRVGKKEEEKTENGYGHKKRGMLWFGVAGVNHIITENEERRRHWGRWVEGGRTCGTPGGGPTAPPLCCRLEGGGRSDTEVSRCEKNRWSLVGGDWRRKKKKNKAGKIVGRLI